MSPHRTYISSLPENLSSYGLTDNGFLPTDDPLTRLPDGYYGPWEDLIKELPQLAEAGHLRARINEMPVLSTCHLETEPEWQRAYSILAFMAQGYIWSGSQPSDYLPTAITVPFLDVSSHLGLQPIASYAGMNLWNWSRRFEGADITEPENLGAITTITGTEDESWFFMISAAMEARAAPLVDKMLEAIEAVGRSDVSSIIYALSEIQEGLDRISKLLIRMYERCRPEVFYHRIRPLLAGTLNMAGAGLPNGVFYDEGEGTGRWRKLRGGSNGQSSLIQLFDAALGVKHMDKAAFHQEMRSFMPQPHASLIDDIEAVSNIRQYVFDHKGNTELTVAYNNAVTSLSNFRNCHIQTATRYVILPARMAARNTHLKKRTLASASSGMYADPNLLGTGGTQLVPFLRQARDETLDAAMVE